MVAFARSKTSSALFVLCVAVVVALCGLAGTVQLTRKLMQRERMQWQDRTDAETMHMAEQLRTGLVERFSALGRVGVWWQLEGRPLDSKDWQTDLRLILESAGGLQRVTWIDASGRRSWSAGHNFLPDARRFDSVPRELKELIGAVRRNHALALSRIFEQPGGRSAVYACVPLLDRGATSAYVAGLYDVTELLESVLQRQIPRDYSVSLIADGRTLDLFQPRTWRGIEQTTSVPVSNVTWLVRVRAAPDDMQGLRRLVMSFGVAISILLAVSTLMGGIAYRRAIALKAEIRERQVAEDRVEVLNRDLQRQLADFQALLAVTPIGIAVSYDAECSRIWSNPALSAMMGVPHGQNISKSGPDAKNLRFQVLRDGRVLLPDELPMQWCGRTGKEMLGEEFDILRGDGRLVHTLAYAAPLLDEEGRVRGVLHAAIDITQRKRAEQEHSVLEQKLLRAEKFKSLALMAGGLAHDLNNLLTSAIGNASLAVEDLPRNSHAREMVLHSLAASQKMAELMQQLVRYTGRTFYTAKPLDISRVIDDLREVLKAGIPPAIELSFDLSANLPLIGAGLSEIQQVLHNLVTNAVDALGEGPGRIIVATGSCELSEETVGDLYGEQGILPGLYVQLVVSDNGCGMPSETAAKAFDPFFTTKFLGRGLGLSEVQGVLRAHRGAVRVESAPATGSTFILLFPALAPQVSMAIASRQ